MTGTLPSLSGLTGLGYFLVNKNQLTGTLPSLAGLNNLIDIEVAQNKLTGTLPVVSALPNLQQLIVSGNQFSGPIPTPPPALIADGSDLRYNALVGDGNPTHTAIWNAAQNPGSDWQATQTVPPIGVSATASGTAVTVSWTPIAYTGDAGAYEVYKSTTPGGPYTLAMSTANKSASSASVPGLSALTTYYFVVATRTDAHTISPDPPNTNNASILRSANSAEVNVATTNPTTPTTTTLTVIAVAVVARHVGNVHGHGHRRQRAYRQRDLPRCEYRLLHRAAAAGGGNYQATYTTNRLATGTHPFTAQYVGNASNATSTSAVLNQVVGAAKTTYSGVTATGTGPASASFTGGGPDCSFEDNLTAFVLPPNSAPVPGATQPHGQFNFKLVNCPPYYPVTMSVTWPSLAGMTYYKYGPTNISGGNPVWYQPDGLVIAGNTATYEISDGMFGDDDNSFNFEIVDPAGPVILPPQPPGTPVASEISNTFGGHTCSRLVPNGFKCWGLNGTMELGNGTNTPTSFPVDVQNVPANTAVIQAARNGTCLFSSTGGLKCWGYNGDGEIGNGTQSGTPTPTPQDVTGLSSGVVQVTSTASGTMRIDFGRRRQVLGPRPQPVDDRLSPDAGRRAHAHQRRHPTRRRLWPHVRADDRRRRQVLGQQFPQPIGRRHQCRPLHASRRHRSHEWRRRHCFRCRPHMRGADHRRAQVLGLQRQRPGRRRRQYRDQSVDAGRCTRPYQRRRGRRGRLQPHLRAPGQWRGQVLGTQPFFGQVGDGTVRQPHAPGRSSG